MINYHKLLRTRDSDLKKVFPDYLRSELRYLKRNIPSKKINILSWDIETSQMETKVWQLKNNDYIEPTRITKDWNIICWSAKALNGKMYNDTLTPIEAKKGDDERVIRSLWKLLNDQDYIIAHNGDCVSKDSLILKQDLTWVKAGQLKEGDKIVGFDENNKKNTCRRIQPSVVLSNRIEKRKAMRVVFDNGDEVVTTPNHPWLKLAAKGRDYRWCETQNLKVGQRVEKFLNPWEQDKSYEAGWFSGFIAGEGTLKSNGASIDFCQRPGKTLERSLTYAKKLDIDVAETKVKIGGLGRGDTLYTYSRGGKWKTLETLGKLGIERLIDNLNWNKFGGLKGQNLNTSTIVEIKEEEDTEMAILTTSTATYFAEGYPMHNSFDIKKANARFLKYGLPLPDYFKTIDTLKISRKYFNLSSNKLDYVCKFVGLEGKFSTGGIALWDACERGDKKALKKMSRYCDVDVKILEKLFIRLMPYIKNFPII